jgi:hypothetical protein
VLEVHDVRALLGDDGGDEGVHGSVATAVASAGVRGVVDVAGDVRRFGARVHRGARALRRGEGVDVPAAGAQALGDAGGILLGPGVLARGEAVDELEEARHRGRVSGRGGGRGKGDSGEWRSGLLRVWPGCSLLVTLNRDFLLFV